MTLNSRHLFSPVRQRLPIILLAAVMAIVVLPNSTAHAAGTFTDDDGSIHESDIEWIASQGITRGCNPPVNDEYCPDDAVTRGQMATFLTRALDLKASGNDFFDDDDTSVHENDIQALAAAGITSGCNPPTNDEYCPDDAVTRGQMATFLTRALDLKASGNDFFDDDDTSVHEGDIQAIAAEGITSGCNPPTNDEYCPDDPVTRGQMASFLRRALAPGQGGGGGGGGGPISATCVQVTGFSQTNQWFSAGDDVFERRVDDGRWQALIQGGGAIDRWIDPNYKGWTNPISSPCEKRSASPDVVLFTVTGGNRSVSSWVSSIEDLLDTIAVKVPSATRVILQPVVGGPGENLCPWGPEDVRASENHPNIDAAIAQVAASQVDVLRGASPVVGSCSHYVDEIGHLTDEGAIHVAAQLGDFYAQFVD